MNSPSPDNQAWRGPQDVAAATSEFNVVSFIIRQALTKVRTASAVKVVACTNDGALAVAGTVDVQPLVNQIDGYGNGTDHGTIYKRPYLRWQGGANAIIMDPKAGDIGLLVICDRDTSKVINTLAAANPGSLRKFDFADGFYIPAVLNGVPTQFIQFNADGITVTSPVALIVNAPQVTVNASTAVDITSPIVTIHDGDLVVHGSITADDDVVGGGISLDTHVHSGVTAGTDDSGPPV